MKTYSITEGEVPHARTSIAQNRDSGNRRSLTDGTADPRSRAAGHARSIETSHQATGRAQQQVSPLWGEATPTGGNGASEHSHDLRTRAGGATTFSLPGVLASLVSS